MSEPQSSEEGADVGYKRPPEATRFKKGRSGNPKGRPRARHRQIPYDSVLGQMVTVREDGRERRITAAEAFILQLTQKGLAGDSAAARASLAAIEEVHAKRGGAQADEVLRVIISTFGLGSAIGDLGIAVKKNRLNKDAGSSIPGSSRLLSIALGRNSLRCRNSGRSGATPERQKKCSGPSGGHTGAECLLRAPISDVDGQPRSSEKRPGSFRPR